MTADAAFMRHALALGVRGEGRVWPNPAVGCVIVQGNRVVGRGWTADGGRPHAETRALAQAGAAAKGATVYVTLEPCAHYGQAPPCADALAAAGVARVVVPIEDPDPRVAGQGLARLRAAGVAVETGCLAAETFRAHRGFLSRIRRGRPSVTLKLAASLDGRIATASGESRWITSEYARRAVHAMRMRHDGVLIGAGTARADDPSLNVRDLGADRQPVRIVVSRLLNLPWPSRLAESMSEGLVWLAHGPEAGEAGDKWRGAGAILIEIPVADGQLILLSLMEKLGESGITRLLCEGGGALAASLLSAGLVDDIALFNAGLALGAEGRPALGALGLATLADAPRFRLVEARAVGNDVLQVWSRD